MLAHQKRSDSRSETRQRLIAAAADEFARHGFANARVRHIVEQAHANLAAVNYHFGGKDGLYRATLAALASESRAKKAAAELAATSFDRLHRHVQRMLERFLLQQQGAALGRILAHEALNPTPHLEELIAETLKPEVEALSRHLAALSGLPVDSQAVTLAALGVLGQCVLFQFAGAALHKAWPSVPDGTALCEAAAAQIARGAAGALPAAPDFTCKAAEAVL
jgi:TetR/AcrR family transcriptional regulator, regulator of cefoperazone and chloramphenicol sensitivity